MLGRHTLNEIKSQPEVLEAVVDLAEREAGRVAELFKPFPQEVIFTGCGSSYYLGTIAALTFRRFLGIRAKAVPASEIMFYPGDVLGSMGRAVLVGVSRSGRTTETLAALKIASSFPGTKIMGMSCEAPPEGLPEDWLWVQIPEASERSIVATRSVTSMLLALQFFAASMSGHEHESWLAELRSLPARAGELLKQAELSAEAFASGAGVGRFVFLGTGPSYGVAREAGLKLTEMACEPAEVYRTLEFRHGPRSAANPSATVVVVPSDSGWALERELLNELLAMSFKVAVVGRDVPGAGILASVVDGLDEWARPVLVLIPLQLLAYHRAILRGCNPDRPRRLTRVVRLGWNPCRTSLDAIG